MQQIFQIAQRAIYQSEALLRSRPYRQFVKSFPCVACRKPWGIDPAHTGPHGISTKASDATCIPLCRSCHRAYDAAPARFAREHHVDIPALVKRFTRLWEARKQMATGVKVGFSRARSLDCSKQKQKRSAA